VASQPVPPLDFVVPGFGKCGSTSLCAMLALHPRVYFPPQKEPWFLGRPDYAQHWDEYRACFDAALPGQLRGDGSVEYLGSSAGAQAARAIARHYPDCRILIIARDPLRRIESSFAEMHHNGHLFGIDCPFAIEDALQYLPQLLADSLYWERSAPYRELFTPEQLRVVFFEDMVREPAATLRDCFEHLGLDPGEARIPPVGLRLNPGEAKLRDTVALRRLKQVPACARGLAALAPARRDRLLRALGLRVRARRAPWQAATSERVREHVGADARRFLRHYGKPEDFWESLRGVSVPFRQ
jgi:hypothetical protein